MTQSQQRFSKANNPCPVCGGYDRQDRNSGDRCGGFLSDDGKYAHCTNSRYAGGLARDGAGSYSHYLAGPCKCGVTHAAGYYQQTQAKDFEPAVKRVAVAKYDYTDEKGIVLYQAIRFEPKGFTQRRPARPTDPLEKVNKGYVYNLEGVRRVIYRLPEILNAPAEAVIFVVEGEKDANRLFDLGLYATTNAMGAGKWNESYNQALAGRDIVIIPDNDDQGRKHARQVAESLKEMANSIKVLDSLPVKEKGDVSDWLDQGHDRAELLALVSGLAEYQPQPPELEIIMASGKGPVSPETELAIIFLCATYPDALYKLEEIGITDEFFYSQDAAYLFNLINRLVSESNGVFPKAFDLEQAISWLGPAGAGRLEYFKKAGAQLVSIEWLDRYLKQLVECHQKRLLLKMAEEIKALALDKETPAEKGIETAMARTEKIEQVTKPINILHGERFAQVMGEYYQQAQCRKPGVPFGIPPIDKMTGGSHLGELTAFAGKRGSGKSALAQQACFYRASNKLRPQLYITVNDMSAPQVFNRFMQQMTGISAGKLAYGRFEDYYGANRKSKVDEYIKKLPEYPLYVVEDNTITSAGVIRLVKSLLRRPEVPALDVYVDYANQLKDSGEIYQKSTTISSNLLDCAHIKGLDGQPRVSLMVLHSLNKDGQLFGPVQNEHDAENIWALNNQRASDRNIDIADKTGEIEIFIEKQRHRTGGFIVKVQWNALQTRFDEIPGTASAGDEDIWNNQEGEE